MSRARGTAPTPPQARRTRRRQSRLESERVSSSSCRVWLRPDSWSIAYVPTVFAPHWPRVLRPVRADDAAWECPNRVSARPAAVNLLGIKNGRHHTATGQSQNRNRETEGLKLQPCPELHLTGRIGGREAKRLSGRHIGSASGRSRRSGLIPEDPVDAREVGAV